eukprot:7824781-Pyramimonas_sp.AAC.1
MPSARPRGFLSDLLAAAALRAKLRRAMAWMRVAASWSLTPEAAGLKDSALGSPAWATVGG